MLSKQCQSCGNVFYKKKTESKKYWTVKKYCSYKCGRKETLKFGRVKGLKRCVPPWNKGLKYDESLKVRLNLSGLELGRMKGRIIEKLMGANNPRWNRIERKCLNCGNTFYAENFRKDSQKWCNAKCYMKWRRGENNPRYKGDKAIVKLKKRIMELAEYTEWHALVLKRDNFACIECNYRGSKLDVHHIKSIMDIFRQYKIRTIKDARECKELWDIKNGQTLCRRCHRKTDTYGRQVNIGLAAEP